MSRSQGLPGSVTHSSRNVRLFPSSSRSTIQGRQPASGRGWSSAGALHVGQETPQERDGAGTHAPGRLSPNPQAPKDRLATLGASPRPQGAMAPPWLPAGVSGCLLLHLQVLNPRRPRSRHHRGAGEGTWLSPSAEPQLRYVQLGAGPGGPGGCQDPEGRALVPAALQLPLHGESEEAAGTRERPAQEWGCSGAQSQPQHPVAQSFPTLRDIC